MISEYQWDWSLFKKKKNGQKKKEIETGSHTCHLNKF